MRRKISPIGIAPLAACALVLLAPRPSAAACWACDHEGWQAWTTYRAIQAPLRFECGCGTCGDNCSPFHTPGYSWVDFVGGISSECNDHSQSFAGPYHSGEWHGCSAFSQEAHGLRYIESVAGTWWDRWPTRWTSGWYETDDISFFLASDNMRDPFGTVYDLDQCWDIDAIGTVYWGDFPVHAQLSMGSTTPEQGFAVFYLEGSAPVRCGPDEGSCRSVVCSDLHVNAAFRCRVIGETCEYPEPDIDPNPYPER